LRKKARDYSRVMAFWISYDVKQGI